MRENIRIGSPLKSRRIRSREPVGEQYWAFMKELREHHKRKAVYEINPYAEVYPIRGNIYAMFSESLGRAGDVQTYLIVGEEKAMMIDTGLELEDLKGLCGELSKGKELIVVSTHPHIDHAYGNCQFEQVHCREYAVPQLIVMNRPDAWEHLFDEQRAPIWIEFDRRDLIIHRPYRVTGVLGGYGFSLGDGHLVGSVSTAGHTSDYCMFLDKKNKLLFASGDVIGMRTGIGEPRPKDVYGACATVVQYRNRMRKLASRLGEFDYMFPGHFVFDLGHEVIEDLTKTAEAIVVEPETYDYAEETGTPGGRILRVCRFVPGLGTIACTERSIGVNCQGEEVSIQTLTGRTCVFSGASGGDGVATVRALHASGMNVAMTTHRLKEAEELAKEINTPGMPGFCMCVTGEGKGAAESRDEILESINERFGPISVVISSIGTDGCGIELQEVTRELLMKSIDHLVEGDFKVIKGALPYLKQSRTSRVMFMTTVKGRYEEAHESCINTVAKGGVFSMVLDSATRLGRYGIAVNCISKGAVKREGRIRPDASKPEELLSQILMGRIEAPEGLTQAVCYLASEETGYITGQVLNVCGRLCTGWAERRMGC